MSIEEAKDAIRAVVEFFTPLLAILGCAFELVSAGFMNHHSIVSVFSSSLDAAARGNAGDRRIFARLAPFRAPCNPFPPRGNVESPLNDLGGLDICNKSIWRKQKGKYDRPRYSHGQ